MKKFLITGAAGFIGSNFVHYLYRTYDSIEVRVLDKLTYAANIRNLDAFSGRAGFTFIEGDICDPAVVRRAMAGVDVVVNFAAETAVDRSIERPHSFLETDIVGVYVLLEEARKQKNVRRFIQISTDEVYGQIMKGSFRETDELKPRNPYAASKLGGERLAYSFFATHNLPVIMTRSSNNYGPRTYPEKVIALFITNLMDGKKIPVYGRGAQVRDWLYVNDHCSAIDTVIDKGVAGEVYNIAANQECANSELARKIITLMGKSEEQIVYVKDRPGHDFRYSLDCAKVRRLGWRPRYRLEEGLRATIQWYAENEATWRPLKEKMDQRYVTGYWG